jgi:bacteriocin resistance YdeI/OmpD-like protein/uncharacterized protein DUF1905
MNNAVFKFKVKLGGAGKYGKVAFFTPPFDVKKTFGTTGRVPVKGTVNGFPFRNSLCQMGGPHFMCVNKALCAGAKCGVGDVVAVVLERDDKKRVMPVPAFMKKAISANKAAKANWEKRPFTYHKEHVLWVTSAKQEETRERRLKKLVEALKSEKK